MKLVFLVINILAICVATKRTSGHAALHFRDVILSPNDNRKAGYITLNNGLPVLLVSDPTGDKAGAAVDVATGSLDDPQDRQGLAHFLEHMLFLGSKKYPAEADFKDYLQLRAGSSNAFTDQWHTNFFFTVQKDGLEGGLDRLAQFFIAPLLSSSPASREVDAVNNEHKKNLQNDDWAMWQLLKHLADPDHPFHKFSTGSKETLGVPGTVHLLRQFYQDHYTSAKSMRLTILGQESLQKLAQWAVTYFTEVPDRERPLSAPVSISVWRRTGVQINVHPIADLRQVQLVWQLPALQQPYRAMVPAFLAHILEGKAEGSLYQSLKAKGWAEDVDLDLRDVRDFTLMIFTISLTSKGMAHQVEVVGAFFGYVQLIRHKGLHCNLWYNKWEMENLNFRFQDVGNVDDFVSRAATMMQYRAPEDSLGSPQNYRCDRHLLANILRQLTPETMLLFSKTHSYHHLHQQEPIYGTRYSEENIPSSQLAAWANAAPFHDMALPGPNPFAPDQFEVFHFPKGENRMSVVEQRPGLRVWHQPSHTFAQPKALFSCELHYPTLLESNSGMLMLGIHSMMLSDLLEAPTNQAKNVGMDLDLYYWDSTLTLYIDGFTASMNRLLRVLLGASQQSFHKDRFEVILSKMIQDVANKKFDNGFNYVWRVLKPLVLEEPTFSPEEQLKALQHIDFDRFMEFAHTVQRQQVHIECLAFGNLQKHQAVTMARRVATAFQVVPSHQVKRREVMLIPPGQDTAVQVPVPNPDDMNSVLLSTYQYTINQSLEEGLKMELAQFITDPVAYSTLRTKEQLGYVVFTVAFTLHTPKYNMSNYHVLIQSSDYPPEYLDDRVEVFLIKALKLLQGISADDLHGMKKGLLDQKWPRPLNLKDEFFGLWREVTGGTYCFDRKAMEAATLPAISREDLVEVFERVLLNHQHRRKVSILVYGKGRPMIQAKGDAKPSKIVRVDSVQQWKSTLFRLPG